MSALATSRRRATFAFAYLLSTSKVVKLPIVISLYFAITEPEPDRDRLAARFALYRAAN